MYTVKNICLLAKIITQRSLGAARLTAYCLDLKLDDINKYLSAVSETIENVQQVL